MLNKDLHNNKLGGEEGFEDFRLMFFRDAGAVVLDLDIIYPSIGSQAFGKRFVFLFRHFIGAILEILRWIILLF